MIDMYLFHGTNEGNAIKIIKGGFTKKKIHLRDGNYLKELGNVNDNDDIWNYYVGPVDFFSNQPYMVGLTRGEGWSDPVWIARNAGLYEGGGAIIVLTIPSEDFNNAVVAIYRTADVQEYWGGFCCTPVTKGEKYFNLLHKKRLEHPSEDCQILVDNRVVNKYIRFGFRVSKTNGDVVRKFNPKYQTKEKHKKKDLRSLIWNETFKLEKVYDRKPFYRKYK